MAKIASLEEARKKDEDLADQLMKLKEEHTEELEARDMVHASELRKLSEQNKNLSANLDTIMRNGQEQQKQLSNDVKLAEDTLAGHMDEINAIHDHLLALANLSDVEDSSARLGRILMVGEMITVVVSAGKAFAAKFFSGRDGDPIDLDQMPSLMNQAAEEHDNVLRFVA